MNKSKEMIWFSRVFMDSTRIKGFRSDSWFRDVDAMVDAAERMQKGEPLPQDRYPKELYAKYADRKEKKQSDLFRGGGATIISSTCANVLSEFDLGETALYPVKLFQHDQKTAVEGEYMVLAFGETKSAFIPEQSPRARKPYDSVDLWKAMIAPKDGDLAVRATALQGVDLWIDPHVWDGLFLSDRLVKALKAAKVSRPWGLSRCRVLHDN